MKEHVTPRALETAEIPGIVEDYRKAAANAKRAGFDGVEVHSANNYLLEQFVRDSTNKRADDYGGSIENRLRFPLAVVEAVCEVWGGGDRVGIRLSPTTTQPGETPLDSDTEGTYGAYVDALGKFGLLYTHVIEGITRATRESNDMDYDALRHRFKGAYISNNRLTLDIAEKELADGHADLFAFGRPFIANPDLVERMKTGAPPRRRTGALLLWWGLTRLFGLAGDERADHAQGVSSPSRPSFWDGAAEPGTGTLQSTATSTRLTGSGSSLRFVRTDATPTRPRASAGHPPPSPSACDR